MSDARKAVIKNADMTEEMQQEAVDIATQASVIAPEGCKRISKIHSQHHIANGIMKTGRRD